MNMKFMFVILTLVIITSIVFSPAVVPAALSMVVHGANPAAEMGEWISIGPEGASVLSLAIDPLTPTTIYAQTRRHVYKSTNGGGEWLQAHSGLPAEGLSSLAINPLTPSTLFVGTTGHGVFRSFNGGNSWDATNNGLPVVHIDGLVMAPTGVIYALTWQDGIYKSTNNGTSWLPLPINDEIENLYVNVMAIDPINPNIIYAQHNERQLDDLWGSYSIKGLFRSTDGGETWEKIFSESTQALAINPKNTTTIYVSHGKLVAVDPLNTNTVYATGNYVHKSTDSGQTWEKIFFGPYDPVRRLYKSEDDGETWRNISADLPRTGFSAIVIDPISTSTLFISGSLAGVHKSVNGGDAWHASNRGLFELDVSALAIDASQPSTIYAGNLKSDDSGQTWNLLYKLPEIVTSLVIDPHTPTTLYAGSDTGNFIWYVDHGVYKSTDGGNSWSTQKSGLTHTSILSMAINPLSPTILYVGTNYGGVFRSTNAGDSWMAVNTGFPDNVRFIYALAIDPKTPSTIYAATNVGVYKSLSNGDTWSPAGSNLGYIYALAIDPINTNTLYAGTASHGVYKSTDGGASWVWSGEVLGVRALVIDPVTPTTVYAGTDSSGVYKSVDGGNAWFPLNNGLPNLHILSLAIDPTNPRKLYAGTNGDSVYLLDQPPPGPVADTPTGVTASHGTYAEKVRIDWNASPGAAYYLVFRNDSNSHIGEIKLKGSPSSSPYNDMAGLAGTTYFYWVKACNAYGCSDYSSASSGLRAYSPIVNGDFEEGPWEGWTEFSTNDFVRIRPFNYAHSGTWAVWLGGVNDADETSHIAQQVTIPDNQYYLNYFYYIYSNLSSCNQDYFRIRINATPILTENLCETKNTTDWVHGVVDLSAYTGTSVELKFELTSINTSDDTWSSVFLDTVSLSTGISQPDDSDRLKLFLPLILR